MNNFAYQHDWPEILELVRSNQRILSHSGYIIHDAGRVADERNLFGAWGVDVARAVALQLDVPEKIKEEYEARVEARKSGDLAVHLQPPVLKNAKGKNFTWSFSAINDWLTCPAQYAAKRYYESIKESPTEATIWGSEVHKALELYIAEGQPLPEGMQHWAKYADSFLGLRARGYEVHVERQVAINRCLSEVPWFDHLVWGRGVVDVLAVQGDTAVIADWKTGKQKDDQFQLDVFCALTNIIYPEVKVFKPRFIWLKTGQVTGTDRTDRDLPRIWQTIIGHTNRIEDAWRTGNFVARSSGLCRGWCPVTTCPYCKEKS